MSKGYMLNCPACRKENKPEAKFCRHCGAPLKVSQGPVTRLPIGTILDNRYKIIDYIAKGGMGAVYKAVDTRNGGFWAVKEMLDYFDDHSEREYSIERFTVEASIIYELDHPSIPSFVDYFIQNGRYYLVMEYIHGTDLLRHLKDIRRKGMQGLDEKDVIRWGIKICHVLYYLHNQNPPIIYRDLKPGNIMITEDEKLYLVDFGIARIFDPRDKATMVGTQGYAPPEQYRGKAEPRSDIYSLSACMHHLLTGKDPRNDIPFNFAPVRSLRPDITTDCEKIVMKALSMDVSRRYASALDMAEDLENLLGDQGEDLLEPADTATFSDNVVTRNLEGAGNGEISPLEEAQQTGFAGELIWKVNLGAPVRSSPVFDSAENLFVASLDGILFCFSPEGEEKWRFDNRSRITSSITATEEGIIYFGSSDSYIYAMDSTGKEIWKYRTYGRIKTTPVVDHNGVIFVASFDQNLYAIEKNGQLKWKMDMDGPLESSPVVSDTGEICLACKNRRSNESFLFCLSNSGRIKWKYGLQAMALSSPLIAGDGTVYIGDSDGRMQALTSDGRLKWEFSTGGPIMATPVAGDSGIYFGSFDNRIYSVSDNGELIWSFPTMAPVTCTPAITGQGIVFCASDDYYIYALTVSDGRVRWKYRTGDRIRSNPVWRNGKRLYAVSDDGFLYVFR